MRRELTPVTNSVPMPSSGHQGVNDRALQEGILEDKFGGLGGKQVDQRWFLLLKQSRLEAVFVQFYGGTQQDRGDCSRGLGSYSACSFTFYEIHFIQTLETSL